MKSITYLMGQRWVLWTLLIINVPGTIYGYIWYESQLKITPAKFLVFVPDSPTASLFFCIVLVGFLLKKNWPLIEALAIVTLFKYGIWAVVMNILTYFTGDLTPVGYMLIFSHLGMAIQGLLYAPYYRIKPIHLVLVAVWTLHNDVIDYVFQMLPRYSMLDQYIPQIGYFTFWLSVTSILIAYLLCVKKDGLKLSFP
ncbi:DUF1405 domain-containing protein [Ferdinandcohnia quinoae]|uniref:DUF1405 domain-containing protein n=1 Tax=Fredinandcohnia quinoae TaxID=2918902 RepID=A0AAW5E552_9BACI|nr:DUF1405 domain-containing protein [Fredinandcohnia sp. SECRCQ15]MCH1624730.1 DUF1405 domain-containing protein [Fredinandcohnia sp. SECRCQ15]